MQGIEVTETDRGGRVTYHGPGQLVAYPIVSACAPYGDDVHEYIRRMERVMIEALGECGVEAEADRGPDRRLGREREREDRLDRRPRQPRRHHPRLRDQRQQRPAAVRVDRPCGIEACRMTSLARELGAEQDIDAFATTVRDRFGEVYERTPVEVGRRRARRAGRRLERAGRGGAGGTVGAMEPTDDTATSASTSPARAPSPGGHAGRRGAPVPRAQAAVAEGAGAGRARPTGG